MKAQLSHLKMFRYYPSLKMFELGSDFFTVQVILSKGQMIRIS